MADKSGSDKSTDNPLMYLLLGKWLHHPLHPAVVHIPLATWTAAFVFDLIAWLGFGGNPLVRASYYLIIAGLISLVIVVPPGIAEWMQIKREKPAWMLALYHMLLNVLAAALFFLSLLFRHGEALLAPRPPLVAFVLGILAFGALFVGGYLGGRMVYQHGIAVARLSKPTWRKMAAAGGANLPPQE